MKKENCSPECDPKCDQSNDKKEDLEWVRKVAVEDYRKSERAKDAEFLREKLRKQIELLSEASQENPDDSFILRDLSHAMREISDIFLAF